MFRVSGTNDVAPLCLPLPFPLGILSNSSPSCVLAPFVLALGILNCSLFNLDKHMQVSLPSPFTLCILSGVDKPNESLGFIAVAGF